MSAISRKDFLKLVGVLGITIVFAPLLSTIKSVKGFTTPEQKKISKEDLTKKWQQWMCSFPTPTNPIFDKDGTVTQKSQPKNESMFYLAGGYVDLEENELPPFRNVKISKEQGIIFPVICSEQSYLEFPNAKSTDNLKALAKQDIDNAYDVHATLDDQPIQYERISTEPFFIYIQEDDCSKEVEDLDIKGYGITECVSDGYWCILEPLPMGKHTLFFKGKNTDIRNTKYHTEVTHNIDVV